MEICITLVKIIVFVLQVTVDLDHFPEFEDDAAFASGMLREQSVFTIPGWVGNNKSWCLASYSGSRGTEASCRLQWSPSI